jgi:hypothetical protein
MHRIDVGPLQVGADADDVADVAFLSQMEANVFAGEGAVIADQLADRTFWPISKAGGPSISMSSLSFIAVSRADQRVEGMGEMGRWGDGETGEMGRRGDGETGRWGDGERRRLAPLLPLSLAPLAL